MATVVKSEMNLGEIVFVFEDGNDEMMITFPQLEVFGDKECTHYLSPFRGYGFQVSGGPNGEGSFGRSEFVGLKNIVKGLNKNVAQGVLYGMAVNALHDHNRQYIGSWYPSNEEQLKIDQFAKVAYDWVKKVIEIESMNNVNDNLEELNKMLEETFISKVKRIVFKK